MAPSSRGRILALDYGRKRIGLALSDELGVTAAPLAVLVRKNRADDLRRIRDTARKYEAKRIVVGLPLRLDGHENEMSEEVTSFAKRLRKHLGLPVEMYDERLSSWQAHTEETRPAKRRGSATKTKDDVAAAIILRDFLAHQESSPSNEYLKEGVGISGRRAIAGKR
jgi:putative Holliday junction resolvase